MKKFAKWLFMVTHKYELALLYKEVRTPVAKGDGSMSDMLRQNKELNYKLSLLKFLTILELFTE